MEENKGQKNKKKLVIAGVVIIGLVIFGVSSYISSSGFESTDNAQLDGDLLPVKAGITSYIDEIRFKDNQEVKRGDTLIIFNTVELKAAVSEIKAELENARANVTVSGYLAEASVQNARAGALSLGSGEQSIRAAKATYDRALQDLQRAKELLSIKAITQDRYEQAQTQMEVAKADHLKAKETQQSSLSSSAGLGKKAEAEQKQIAVAQTVIHQKEAELEAAIERLHHAFIIAPFDGIVTKRSVQVGQFITSGQSLCAIINHKNLWVTANFKETQLSKIKPGQQVEVTIDAYHGLKLQGTIDSYGGATGSRFALIPPDNATGNFIKIAQRFPLRIRLKGQGIAEQHLYPGLSVFVKVKVD